jgi:hypothetical protein
VQIAYLRLLHAALSTPRLRLPEHDGFASSWSAAFLEPLLQLHSVTNSGAVLQLCQAVLHALLVRLRLHEGDADQVRRT